MDRPIMQKIAETLAIWAIQNNTNLNTEQYEELCQIPESDAATQLALDFLKRATEELE